jgi:transposase
MGMPGPQMMVCQEVEFKLAEIKMSNSPGVLIMDLAESIRIHSFRLSTWRKQLRDR